MAKLYFRYGTVGSAKTLNLLAVAHNYLQQDKRAFIIKPELDVRFGRDLVHSRAGVEKRADLLVSAETQLDLEAFAGDRLRPRRRGPVPLPGADRSAADRGP